MNLYVVIQVQDDLRPHVERVFQANNRSEIAPHVWFVRGAQLTSAEVVRDLGIDASTHTGIVVTAQHYDGTADREHVEKLSVWEREKS